MKRRLSGINLSLENNFMSEILLTLSLFSVACSTCSLI